MRFSGRRLVRHDGSDEDEIIARKRPGDFQQKFDIQIADDFSDISDQPAGGWQIRGTRPTQGGFSAEHFQIDAVRKQKRVRIEHAVPPDKHVADGEDDVGTTHQCGFLLLVGIIQAMVDESLRPHRVHQLFRPVRKRMPQ